MGDFVAYAYGLSVPAAAGIGEVERVSEVGVEHGFEVDAESMYIVMIPKLLVVVAGEWAAVCASDADGCNLPELFQLETEVVEGCFNIAVACGEVLIVVADGMSHAGDCANGLCMGCKVLGTEVIGCLYVHGGLYLCDA